MTTYTANPTTDRIAPGSFAATELLSRVGGFIAGCGQAALAVLIGASKGQILTANDVTSLIQESVNAHVTVGGLAASGQSSPDTLNYLAQQKGVPLTSLDWQSALAYAGQRDVILGVSNATAFGGNDSNVQGHYVTIVGTQGPNYIVSDPNSTESTQGRYVVYTPQQIANAQPFWAAVPTNPPASGQTLGSNASNGGGNALDNIGSALSGISSFVQTIQSWFTPPTRALKFVAGLGLMFLSLAVVFLPDIAAGAASATGNPEVGAAILSANKGPKGVAGAGIRALGNVAGRQRTANKQAVRAERAANTATLQLHPTSERAQNLRTEQAQAAQARTLERTQRVERAQTTVNLLNKRIARYSGGTRSSGPGNLATPSTARPVPSPAQSAEKPAPDFSKEQAGHLGPLIRVADLPQRPKTVPRPKGPTTLPTMAKGPRKKAPVKVAKAALTPKNVAGYRTANPEGVKLQRTDLAPPAPDAVSQELADANGSPILSKEGQAKVNRNYRRRYKTKSTENIRRLFGKGGKFS